MNRLLALAVLMSLAFYGSAEAATKSAKSAKEVKPSPKPKLSRNLKFNGSAVDGKYHSAGESIAQVETEKSLSELMGIRKNFRDRIGAEQRRLENGEGVLQ